MSVLFDKLGVQLEKGDFVTFSQAQSHPFEIVDTGELVQQGPGGIPMRVIRFVGKIALPISPDAPQIDAYKVVWKPTPPASKLVS